MDSTGPDPKRRQELRRLAEAKLEKELPGLSKRSSEESQPLIQELRTHQIELEMQNEELRVAQQELIESRDRYADLYDFAPIGYVTVNHKGLILEANLTLADMLGVQRRAMLQQPLSAFIVPNDQDIYYRHRRKLLASRQRDTCQLRLFSPSTEAIWTEMETILMESDDENEPRIRTMVTDITQRKMMEERLAHNEQLALIGQLATGVAHELNTPLTNISLLADNLKEECEGPMVQEFTEKIIQQVEYSARIIRKLLAFAHPRIDTQQTLDLHRIIQTALQQHKLPQWLKLEQDLISGPVMVKGDPTQLQEVIFNLLTNAVDAMRELGSGTLTIATSFNGPNVELTVTDTGVGIKEEDHIQIFAPFFTSKPTGQGIGLGLPVVWRHLRAHEGAIDIDSKVGRGTRVKVKLPVL